MHIAYKKYRFSEFRAPFAPLGPCFAATSLKFPHHQGDLGELEMLLLRRGCSAGFRLRRASLLERLLQVFFPPLFSSRLFFFFPSQVFTGLPAARISPLPSRLFFLPLPDLLDLGAPREGHQTTHVQLLKPAPLQPNFLIQSL